MFYSLACFVFTLFFLSGCGDNATISINEKNLPKEKIHCLKLLVFPPDEQLQKSFEELYTFTQECPYLLEVSAKSGITCNSNQNYQTKATGEFPSSYLRMQVNKGRTILYGYYIDLLESPSKEDVKRAFSRLEEDLSL